jgi:hypothetical protein
MRKRLLAAGAVLTLAAAGAAHAGSVVDPTGDFLATYAGSHDADLDVTKFSVTFDGATNLFTLNATFAGAIDPTKAGLYVFGINTGTGVNHPFGAGGNPDTGNGNVLFNQVFVVQKTGAATLGGQTLATTISGADLGVIVPLALLPTTGFAPGQYGWNLWPRNGVGGNNTQIADFAPNNATLQAIPEPGTWALMLIGFGALGATLRRRRTAMAAAQPA